MVLGSLCCISQEVSIGDLVSLKHIVNDLEVLYVSSTLFYVGHGRSYPIALADQVQAWLEVCKSTQQNHGKSGR